uniref:FBA_2 domain-containing protein n=1 Tax=Caenorhabditis tropicalis TaxID=1561998 RepID=A0A1I7TT73_9PELO
MDYIELIVYSLLSRKTKNDVTKLKKESFRLYFFMNEEIRMTASFDDITVECTFHDGNYIDDSFQKVVLCQKINFGNQRKELELKNEKMGIEEWTDHFRIIFHQRYIGLYVYNESIDIPAIARRLKNVNKLADVNGKGQKVYSFVDRLETRILVTTARNCLRNGLIQNFESIYVGKHSEIEIDFGLNEFLLLNPKTLTMCCVNVTLKSINRFLKLWKKGACRRMKRFRLCCADLCEFNVFQGIDAVFSTEPRSFDTGEKEETIESGYDIVRKDGTKGTCVYKRFDDSYQFHFYVWHSH